MKYPSHIAFIMDGNGRWAEKKGLPRFVGHSQGVKVIKKIVKSALNFRIKYITLFAFSTENWNRPKNEVDYLMELFINSIKTELEELSSTICKFKIYWKY